MGIFVEDAPRVCLPLDLPHHPVGHLRLAFQPVPVLVSFSLLLLGPLDLSLHSKRETKARLIMEDVTVEG
jgi:hypothetical protein